MLREEEMVRDKGQGAEEDIPKEGSLDVPVGHIGTLEDELVPSLRQAETRM